MFLIKGETSAAPMAVEDVVNNGKTCQDVPALPTALAKTPIFPVIGSKTAKMIAGTSLFEWKNKATVWIEHTVSVDPIVGEFQSFDLGEVGIWMVPLDWGKENPSRILDQALTWNGFEHQFKGKIWSGFSVFRVLSWHNIFHELGSHNACFCTD